MVEYVALAPEIDQLRDLVRWTSAELNRLAQAVGEIPLELQVAVLARAPDKPRIGLIVYADGTNWDPGAGQGFYGYTNSGWVKLYAAAVPEILSYVKLANETRVNDATYTVDLHLVSATLPANATYRIEMLFIMSGDTAQDLRFRVERTGLADATLTYTGDLDNPVAATLTWNSAVNNNLAGTARRMGNYIGVVKTNTDTGTLQLAWGQQVAGTPTNVTTLHAGSFIQLQRIA